MDLTPVNAKVAEAATLTATPMTSPRFKSIDVRKLLDAGRDPFPVIRKTVDKLRPGEGLEIIAPFIPAPLIEKLGSEGFAKSIERDADGTWVTQFWRPDPAPDAPGD